MDNDFQRKLREDAELKKFIQEESIKAVQVYLRQGAFTDRKLTDTPTDSLSVVNRRYVTLNGTLASRPAASVASLGQRYFETDNDITITFNGTNWVNSVGSVVASG